MSSSPLSTVIRHLRRVLDSDAGGAPTDAQLVERYLHSRDESAFELLVWRHGGMVLDLCRRLLPQAADAEDAFQATFLTLVRKAHTIGKRGSVGSWLYKVAYRVATEARARSARRSVWERRARVRTPPTPEHEAVQREVRPLLEEEINRLPERYRAPFVLCCLEGRSLEEAARQLDCPRATVGTRVARARQRLRDRLAGRGVLLSAGAVAALTVPGPASASPPAALVGPVLRAALAAARDGALAPGTVSPSVLALVEAVSGAGRPWKLWLLAGLLLTGAGAAALGPARRGGEGRVPVPSADAAPPPVREVPGAPRGWVAWSDQPTHFEVGRDAGSPHGGRASGYVQLGDAAGGAKAVLRQAVQAGPYRGRRVRLAGWLRTRGPGRSGLFLRVDGVDLMLGLANMEDRAVAGESGWRLYDLVLDVPPEAADITFGLWRDGPGRTWVDDFTLEAVAHAPATNLLTDPCPITRVPSEPPPAVAANLDFEDARAPLPVARSAPPWLGLLSRESGEGPVLLITRPGGAVERVEAAADAVLLSYQPDRECGELRTLAVSLADTNRTLVRFAPAPGPVEKAELVLRCGASPCRPAEPFTLAVHELREAWREEDVTWQSQPAFAGAPAAVAPVPPDAAEVCIDVTRLVRAAGGREMPGPGWLLKVPGSRADAGRALPPDSGTGLHRVLPWENSVSEARRKAREGGKLVLAYVRCGRWDEATALGEQLLLGTSLSDPDVLALVRSRFVPVRVRVRDGASAAGGEALRGLGLPPGPGARLALVVSSPDGAPLARLPAPQELHRDRVLRFLLGALPEKSSAGGDDPWSLLEAGRLDEARAGLAGKGPQERAYGLSRVAALRGDYEEALRLAGPLAAGEGPFRHKARYECAVARMRLGRFQEAARDFRATAAEPAGPCAADGAYYLGCLLYRAQDIDGALAVWRGLAAEHPASPAAARARLRLARPGLMARHECLTAPAAPSRGYAHRDGDGKPPC